MRSTNLKKLFSVCLACAMTICLLAGCNKAPDTQTTPATTDPVVKNPTPVGMLILSAGASVNISYDADGMVLKLSGNNEEGNQLTEDYTDYLGKSCSAVAKELVEAAEKAGYLTLDIKNIVIKQSIRSQLPGEFFLETIENEVKAAVSAAGSTAAVTVIGEDGLDGNGYLTLATVKALLCIELGVEQLDKYYGDKVPNNGIFICTAEVAGVQSYHKIDAVTGLITAATAEELLGDPFGEDESFEDDITEDEYLEETIEQTEEVIQPTENNSVPEETQETPVDTGVEEEDGDIDIPIE